MVKISNVRVRPLVLPLKQPYHWSYGIRESFAVNLIEIEADDGTVGIGECTVAPDQTGTAAILYRLAKHLVGHSPHDVAPLIARIFHQEYLGHGANIMRAANQNFPASTWPCGIFKASSPACRFTSCLGALTGRRSATSISCRAKPPRSLRAMPPSATPRARGLLSQGRPRREARPRDHRGGSPRDRRRAPAPRCERRLERP